MSSQIKVSDAIVEILISNGITDAFGYPGGMVIHLMDSFRKYENQIKFRLCYQEQGAAFEACSYALISHKTGIAIATSGPGATNLITGIAQAYFDSIPTIFITGQVNTNESSLGMPIRQRGFQETNIVEIVKPITKATFYVDDPKSIYEVFYKAFQIANEGRKGPVLIDLPMNISRAMIDRQQIESVFWDIEEPDNNALITIENELRKAKRPVFLIGNGIKNTFSYNIDKIRKKLNCFIPCVCSLPAVDVLPTYQKNNFGMIGAYGNRTANIIVNKADLVVSFGARLDVRQVGGKRENFAPKAKVIRIDIDENELSYKIRQNEIGLKSDAYSLLLGLNLSSFDFRDWFDKCSLIKNIVLKENLDCLPTNDIVSIIGKHIDKNAILTTDVGQNQIWVAQSFPFDSQTVLTSSSLGSMGYSLPAAIGAYYGSQGKKNVISFNGDGGIQMNMQELGVIAREKLPIKIVIFNNEALGMIRVFQEIYFDDYFLTTKKSGFSNPKFDKLAEAYGIDYCCLNNINEQSDLSVFNDDKSRIIEILIKYPTYVYPKLKFGESNDNQLPYISSTILEKIRSL